MVGDAGLVVPVDDVDALRAGLESLTTSPDATLWGQRAAANARMRFTVERCALQHLDLYDSLRRRRGFRGV
jgi:glycosyltransferase involved in cell wall biosynthesis